MKKNEFSFTDFFFISKSREGVTEFLIFLFGLLEIFKDKASKVSKQQFCQVRANFCWKKKLPMFFKKLFWKELF